MNIQHSEISCTGCGICAFVCPASCIEMKYDGRGFLSPTVDSDRCIDCGNCVRVCPDLCPPPKHPRQESGMAVWSAEKETRSSGSGGAFCLTARQFIREMNGVVYGCALNLKNGTAEHIRVADPDGLYLIQGSKYVQSDPTKSYDSLKNDLEKGVKVLFSGTPCQVAGVVSAFGKFDNLYTADVVCHGVPSPVLFRDYLSWIEEKTGPLRDYRFRLHTKRRIQGYTARAIGENGRYEKTAQADPYFHAFLNELDYRDCCYRCQYTTAERVGDVSFGDCNSVAYDNPGFSGSNCASFVLINSQKGAALWENCRKAFSVLPVPLDAEIKYNRRLVEPSSLDAEKQAEIDRLHEAGLLFDRYPYYGRKSLSRSLKKKLAGMLPEYWLRLLRYYVKK